MLVLCSGDKSDILRLRKVGPKQGAVQVTDLQLVLHVVEDFDEGDSSLGAVGRANVRPFTCSSEMPEELEDDYKERIVAALSWVKFSAKWSNSERIAYFIKNTQDVASGYQKQEGGQRRKRCDRSKTKEVPVLTKQETKSVATGLDDSQNYDAGMCFVLLNNEYFDRHNYVLFQKHTKIISTTTRQTPTRSERWVDPSSADPANVCSFEFE
jgi:hypothetical protein